MDNAAELWPLCDGAIVGTALKRDGRVERGGKAVRPLHERAIHVGDFDEWRVVSKAEEAVRDADDQHLGASCQIDDRLVDGAIVDPNRDHRQRLQEDSLDRADHELPDDDVVDDLDAAGGRTGAGAHETHGEEEHLGRLGPQLVVLGSEAGRRQQGHHLESAVSQRVQKP